MSRSTYYIFGTDGTLRDEKEMSNGRGSADVIWQAIKDRYGGGGYCSDGDLRGFNGEVDTFAPEDAFLYRCTFGAVVIPRGEWAHLRAGIAGIDIDEGRVSHWPDVFEWLKEFEDDETVLGLGIRVSSVVENPWYKWAYPECPHCRQNIEYEGGLELIDVLERPMIRLGEAS